MYESLTRYLPEFERGEIVGTWIDGGVHAGTPEDPLQLPYVEYGEMATGIERAITAFVSDHPEFCLTSYSEILENAGLAWDARSMEAADVSVLDGRTAMALLVGAVRADRFCEGAYLGFFESGCIERWLRRLKEIDEA